MTDAANDLASDRPDPARAALYRSVNVPAPLDDVAAAVATACEYPGRFYVERRRAGYRWSFAHSGGPYPMLRVTARFLRVDYFAIAVLTRPVADGVCISCPELDDDPEAWAVLDLEPPLSPAEVAARIRDALGGELSP